ncbi:MAG: hypothetical protein NUV90_00845 [Candidatus Parcubacteria bacterium]|nr:hypothetical protein [Candidatus Parcubacteria bacterium]
MASKIFTLLIALVVVGVLTSRNYDYKDQLYFSEVRYATLAKEYEDHLYAEYSKTICDIERPKLDGTDKRASNAKDLACMVGVREKAKKEVEAIKK